MIGKAGGYMKNADNEPTPTVIVASKTAATEPERLAGKWSLRKDTFCARNRTH